MRERIKQYFLECSAENDAFGGYYIPKKINASGVLCGIIVFPILILVYAFMLPFNLLAKALNKL